MTSFGWKRKQVTLQENPSTSGFSEEDDRDPEVEAGEIDWLTAAKRHRGGALEDGRTKAERLRSDGVVLAESGRFWEAIRIWDEALGLTPDDARLYEMKAQALIELREDFAAVQSAEEAVRYDPLWAEARQTLGRAQLNLGEPHMALKNFCKALHLAPWLDDVREEDLKWTLSVVTKAKEESNEQLDGHVRARSALL